jgi:DAK2 domain fusion protein YloV
LDAATLADAFLFATDWLGVYIEEVNALNVYPVPDGDTGTNMHLTMQSVRRQLQDAPPTGMNDLAHALSYGSLLGARGNSGVILSQILKGFAEGLKGTQSLDATTLKQSLQQATDTAYAAVMKPVEGTMLSVIKAIGQHAEVNEGTGSALELLRSCVTAGHEALEHTPEQLPLLKQAGVVDAGGLGLLRILEGILAHYDARELPEPPEVERRAQESFEEEEFGFCTEFLLADVDVPTSVIQELVAPYGDSLLVVGAEGFVKGHIHTEEPERLLASVAKHGRMVRSKVEDMSEQHSEILAAVDADEAELAPVAMVAVADGYGVTKIFRSLGARVVGGGQTNNPSVEDIVDAVRSVGAEHVVVMPNNKNIVLAAERVPELVSDRSVHVLRTTTMGQGLAAAVAFTDTADVDTLLTSMQESANASRTVEVTVANRTATVEGVDVEEGDAIALVDGKLVSKAPSYVDVLAAAVRGLDGEPEVATLFHASSVPEADVESAVTLLEEAFDDLEVEVHPGAPDLYPFVVVFEGFE